MESLDYLDLQFYVSNVEVNNSFMKHETPKEEHETPKEAMKLPIFINEPVKTNRKGAGRKVGQVGIKCQRKRYDVKHIGPDGTVTDVGKFATIQEIADLLGYTYGQIYGAFKSNTALSKVLKITTIPKPPKQSKSKRNKPSN